MEAVAVLSADQIRRLVADGVQDALQAALPSSLRQALRPRHVTRQDAAEMAGLSVRQIDYLREAGKIDWFKRGGRVLIDTDSLMAYIEAGRVPANVAA